MRWAGAALLSAAAAWLGLHAALQLGRRTSDLRAVLCGLSAMERALADRGASLREMLWDAAQVSRGLVGGCFRCCADEVAQLDGRPFRNLWETSFQSAALTLRTLDVQIVEELGAVLGRYDVDSQCRALQQAMHRLERQLEEAEEEQSRMGRVYSTLGVSAGLLLFLLFL